MFKFKNLSFTDSFDLIQKVNFPTHILGHTLDLDFAGWHLGANLNHSFTPNFLSPLLYNKVDSGHMVVSDWPGPRTMCI